MRRLAEKTSEGQQALKFGESVKFLKLWLWFVVCSGFTPVMLVFFCLTRQGIRGLYPGRNEVGSKINQAASQK
jgi:hypothetical protein